METTVASRSALGRPGNIAGCVTTGLPFEDREVFVAVLMDTCNQALGINTVSISSLSASIVPPREAFKAAIVKQPTTSLALGSFSVRPAGPAPLLPATLPLRGHVQCSSLQAGHQSPPLGLSGYPSSWPYWRPLILAYPRHSPHKMGKQPD